MVGIAQQLGAIVLLPKGYDEHPNTYYPVVYQQYHFSLEAPFGFTEDSNPPTASMTPIRLAPVNPRSNVEGPARLQWGRRTGTGFQFYKSWMSDAMPRMIVVSFLHPTPFFDDSYAVNSANNGPYGDAIMKELIPYVESHFRIIRKPYARVLTGGSTGGWDRWPCSSTIPNSSAEPGRFSRTRSTSDDISSSISTPTRTRSCSPMRLRARRSA